VIVAEIEEIEGGCLCGTVRYRVRGPWLRFVHCHCSRCRKATGTGHATNLFVDPDRLQWIAGQANVQRYDLPTAQRFAVCFCRACGSPLPHRTRTGSGWVIPAGSLDREPSMAPSARIFWSSRASWSCAAGDLPCFDGYMND